MYCATPLPEQKDRQTICQHRNHDRARQPDPEYDHPQEQPYSFWCCFEPASKAATTQPQEHVTECAEYEERHHDSQRYPVQPTTKSQDQHMTVANSQISTQSVRERDPRIDSAWQSQD